MVGGGRERFTESRWKDDRCGWSTGTRGRMVAVFDPDLGQDPYNHLESAHGAGSPKLGEAHDYGGREARTVFDPRLDLRVTAPVYPAQRYIVFRVQEPRCCREASSFAHSFDPSRPWSNAVEALWLGL